MAKSFEFDDALRYASPKAFEIFLFEIKDFIPKANHSIIKFMANYAPINLFAMKSLISSIRYYESLLKVFVCDDLPKTRRFHTTLAYFDFCAYSIFYAYAYAKASS